GRDGPQQPRPRRSRFGQRVVLPVAGFPAGRREVPFGHAAALRDGNTDLARGGAARGRPCPALTATAALLWDWQSWWAMELEWRPSVDLDFRGTMAAWYEQLWRDHIAVDF